MKYIVGCGITGTIAKRFFPEAKIIAPDGGFLPSPFVIWKDSWSLRFAKEFGLNYEEKTFMVGKTGTEYAQYNALTYKPVGNIPCEGRNSFDGLVFNEPFFKYDFINDKIVNVNENALDGLKKSYNFSKVIWCAHVDKTFFSFLEKQPIVEYHPVTFFRFWRETELFDEYIHYFLDKESLDNKFYRSTKENEYYVFEFSGDFGNLNTNHKQIDFLCKKFNISKVDYDKCWVISKALVSSTIKPIDSADFKFVGRFAECDNEVKVNDVIKKFYKIRELWKHD